MSRPVIDVGPSRLSTTGAATLAVRACAAVNPTATAPAMTTIAKRPGALISWRPAIAAAPTAAHASGPSHHGGSLDREKYPLMPIPTRTGTHRIQRSCSAAKIAAAFAHKADMPALVAANAAAWCTKTALKNRRVTPFGVIRVNVGSGKSGSRRHGFSACLMMLAA